jgi:hypothetical protein
MANVAKVACSIDAELLARVEAVRKRTGESRSAFIGRALRMLTSESARQAAVARYVDAYQRQPESPADVRAARASARDALARLAWDPE